MFLDAYENQDKQVLMGFTLPWPQLISAVGAPQQWGEFSDRFLLVWSSGVGSRLDFWL